MSWKEELFDEKNLWQVYVRARRLTGSKFNHWATRLGTLLILVTISYGMYFSEPRLITPTDIIAWVREWSSTGISFATSTLGFLIAGFSIFASVTNKKLFIALAHLDYRDTGVSRLKFIFFNFIVVFLHYLSFLGLCLFVKLFFGPSGPLSLIVQDAIGGCLRLEETLVLISALIIGTWFIAIVLMLKSFIWNLYQAVLLAIATEAEFIDRRKS